MSWDNAPTNFINQVESDTAQLCRVIAFDAYNGVTGMSPVDTGRFRASWNFSEGQPDVTVSEGGSFSFTFPPNVPSKPFPVYYITNALPYAEKLENGHSGQAPFGMVQITVSRLDAKYS